MRVGSGEKERSSSTLDTPWIRVGVDGAVGAMTVIRGVAVGVINELNDIKSSCPSSGEVVVT